MRAKRRTATATATAFRRAARAQLGFTLVELMVSLIAGLFVTIAVIGLARAATRTFFEAARISSVESSVRSGAERLRQDLTRVSYMGTGNIKLARSSQITRPVPLAHRIAVKDPALTTGSRYTTFDELAGIRILVGGSGVTPTAVFAGPGTTTLTTDNGLNPDALVVAGNFTSDDAYTGKLRPGGACTNGQQVVLNGSLDAAVGRLIGTTTAAHPNDLANLQSAFTPVTVPAGYLYGARAIDAKGCQHYVVVCSVAIQSAGIAVINLAGDKNSDPAVLPQAIDNCGGAVDEEVSISPLQRMAWYIGANTADLAVLADTTIEPMANKYNLYRVMLSAADPPAPIPETRQVIAEYAVDLKFGISAIDAVDALQIFEMDGDPGTGPISLWTQGASTTAPTGTQGPQRVRSVRFRLATRAPIPDRDINLTVPPGPPYLARYCVEGVALATCKKLARTRTVVSEVALLNQFGMAF